HNSSASCLYCSVYLAGLRVGFDNCVFMWAPLGFDPQPTVRQINATPVLFSCIFWRPERKRGAMARKLRREEADPDHGQRHAERIIMEMLEGLGMSEREVVSARKGDWRKRIIAQRVRQETSVTLRWLTERLGMGSEGHLSRVSGCMKDLASHPGWRSFRQAQ
ncbi:MAG TPA: hypothetical protein VJU77_11355, partial [Chthoniobacterales bacterium]|nr:hypothetical protein [Chthoniobacterales bacterium]